MPRAHPTPGSSPAERELASRPCRYSTSAWGISMRKGWMPSLIAVLLVHEFSCALAARLGKIREIIVPRLSSGSGNAGNIGAAAAPAIAVAGPPRLDQCRARGPAPRGDA